MPKEFFDKVSLIAKHKYELDEEVLEAYMLDIQLCWDNGFSAIRTVEYIAAKIF